MRKTRVEKLKFYILMLLIASSLLQVGYLWTYQSYGFPANFIFGVIKGLSNEDFVDMEEKARSEIFQPYRLIVSEGYSKPRYVLQTRDKYYNSLWEKAKAYLKAALEEGRSSFKPIPPSEWNYLSSSKSITYEFAAYIPMDLLSWFLNLPNPSDRGPSGMIKVTLMPWDNPGVVYVKDKSEIYECRVENLKAFAKQDLDKLLAYLQNNSHIKYDAINDFFPDMSPEILGIINQEAAVELYTISSSLSKWFDENGDFTSSDVENIAEHVLGNEKDSFDRSLLANKKEMEFKTQNSMYSVYSNGVIEYRHLSPQAGLNRGDLKDAFLNAYGLVNRLLPLTSGADVYLSMINTDDVSSYEFCFDYIVEGIPVIIDVNTPKSILGIAGETNLPHAFTIRANSSGILRASAIPLVFSTVSRKKYNISFIDAMEKAFSNDEFRERVRSKGDDIQNIYIAYKVPSSKEDELDPVWTIKTIEGDFSLPISPISN